MVFKKRIKSVTLCVFISATLLLTMNASATEPMGYIDGVWDGLVHGWAYDPDEPSSQIEVHLYFDDPSGSGWGPYGVTTNIYRPDVNAVKGITGNHGFQYPVPENFKDGNTHTVYGYGINTRGGSDPELFNSPARFTVTSPVDTPADLSYRGDTGTYSFTLNRVQGGDYKVAIERWVQCSLGTDNGELVGNSATISITDFEAINPSDTVADFTLWDWTVTEVLGCTNMICTGYQDSEVEVTVTATSSTQLQFTWNFNRNLMCVNNWASVEFSGSNASR